MTNRVENKASRLMRKKRNHRKWLTGILCLALIVALGTGMILMVPGVAMTENSKILDCPVAAEGTLVAHTHNDDCYDAAGNLVCTLPEIELHTHDASCYAEKTELICTLEESEEHTHTEECYETTKILVCGKEEVTEVHVHGADCLKEAAIPEENTLAESAAEETEAVEVGETVGAKVSEPVTETPVSDSGDLDAQLEIPEEVLPEGTVTEVTPEENEKASDNVEGEIAPIQTVDFVTADGKTLKITLTPESKDVLPENATLKVTEIGFEDPEWNSRSVQLADALFDKYGNVTISDARFLSLEIMVDNKEFKLEGPVEVKVEYTDKLVTEDLAEYSYDEDAGRDTRPDPEDQISHFAVISYTDGGAEFLVSSKADGTNTDGIKESEFKAKNFSEIDFVYVYEYTAPSAD